MVALTLHTRTQDPNTNVARVGYVASVATSHRGVTICSLISPFEGGRRAARELVESAGDNGQTRVCCVLCVLVCVCVCVERSFDGCGGCAWSAGGMFVEVFVSTSVATCAARDVKGLYKKASEGLIELTGAPSSVALYFSVTMGGWINIRRWGGAGAGVNHPYEMPDSSELVIDGGSTPPDVAVEYIIGARACGGGGCCVHGGAW